jgi:hypothetical protein
VFGNERGKVFIEDANDRADDECTQFERRRAERKAAKLNAMEASLATGSASSFTTNKQNLSFYFRYKGIYSGRIPG